MSFAKRYVDIESHPDYPRGTGVILDGVTHGFTLMPSAIGKHTFLGVGVTDPSRTKVFTDDGGKAYFVNMDLDLDELDELIATLQRARSGCFFGRFPHEGNVAPVTLDPVDMLAEMFGVDPNVLRTLITTI